MIARLVLMGLSCSGIVVSGALMLAVADCYEEHHRDRGAEALMAFTALVLAGNSVAVLWIIARGLRG